MTMPNTSPATPPGHQPTTREQLRDIRNEAMGQAKDTVRQARERAAASLGESKTRFADQVGNMARAFHQTSDRLRTEDQARVADLTDALARQVDQVADYLRSRDGRAMRQDLERLVRRQPGLFVGGAFALGLLGARFLKSGQRAREGDGRARTEFPERPATTAAPMMGAGGYDAGA